MNFKKKLTITSIALASTIALAACGQQSAGAGDVVATGNSVEVTNEELTQEMKKLTGDQVLQQLILTDIFEAEVGEDRVKELQEESETSTAALIAQYGGEEQFMSVIQAAGYDEKEDYTEALYYLSLMNEAIAKSIDIADEEVQAAYDEYQPPIEASHILVETEEEAQTIIDELNNGGDFAELAKEHSLDATAENGGALGEVSRGQMVKEFEDAAFALGEGEVSKEPVQSEFGYHIIKVTAKPEKGSLEEEKEQLTKTLRLSKLSDPVVVQTIVSNLIEAYNIDISDEDLADALDAFKVEEPAEESSAPAESSTESASEETTSEESSAE